MDAQHNPDIGDWLVHQKHGVGQFNGKATMHIGGKESNYFRLEIENGTIFVPEDRMNNENFRPIASQKTILEMIDILSRPPKKMAKGFLVRTNQISVMMRVNSLLDMARIVRDLYGRRRARTTLSVTEQDLLQKLSKRVTSEWAVVTGLDENEIQKQMRDLLFKQKG
jgi:RNA polymerase-interacting CarD/CdnL/TRCF family regulator